MAPAVDSQGASPRVSVVMAVRNCEPYLAACLASLARQYFTSYEIVIIDDGSTDRTPDVIDELSNANPGLPITAHRSREQLGIAATRNTALSLAVGEYIAVQDGDDLCRADRLAQQAGFLDANSNCFCVGSVAMRIAADGAQCGILDCGVRSHEQLVRQLLAGNNPIINSSTMFRRRAAIEVLGGYATDGPAAIVEDLDLWYRAVLAGLRFHVLPDPLVFYRSNPAGHTHTRKLEIQEAHQLRLGEFRRDFERLAQPGFGGASARRAFGSAARRSDPFTPYDAEPTGRLTPPAPHGEPTGRLTPPARHGETTGRLTPPARHAATNAATPAGPLPRRRPRGGPIRAAFLTPILHLGGAEQWLLSLLKRCDPSHLRWTGVALTDQAPVHPGFCREVAVHAPVYGSGPPRGENVVRCQTPRDALLSAAQDADVLVTWGLWNIRPVVEAVAIPVVYVSHGSGDWAVNCARAIENEPIRLAAVSEAARAAFSPAVRDRVSVIHNGIEVDRCTPSRSREDMRAAWGFDARHRLVGYAGRYSGEKNPAAAAVAVARLPDHFHAVYAGSGLHEAAVRSMVEKSAGERARFVPADRRIGNLMQAFDVMVMASPAEGFSLLIAEAWYCGVPVVATRVGAVPELEAAFGRLVSPVSVSPTAEELAQAVEIALSPSFRREVVPRARALVAERFTATRMAERWTDYLIGICAENALCAEPWP